MIRTLKEKKKETHLLEKVDAGFNVKIEKTWNDTMDGAGYATPQIITKNLLERRGEERGSAWKGRGHFPIRDR